MPNYINTITPSSNGQSLTGGTSVELDDNLRAVYSNDIIFKAMPQMRFLQFARQQNELGVQPGLTINILAYDNISKGGTLTEGVRMSTKALSSSLKSVTVAEKGNAVSVSELTLRASFDNVMERVTTLLARDMAITLDTELRDACLTGGTYTSTIYGRADKNAAKISARANITATHILSVATIKDAIEILATNNAPKFEGAYYISFVHPHQSRTLRDDPAWVNASNYGAAEQLFTGEIGRIDGTRFIETTLMCNGAVASTDYAYKAALVHGASGAPANVDVYQAVVFGEDYFAHAVALPTELRDGGVVDFGRERSMAWYAIWGTAVLQSENGVIVETA